MTPRFVCTGFFYYFPSNRASYSDVSFGPYENAKLGFVFVIRVIETFFMIPKPFLKIFCDSIIHSNCFTIAIIFKHLCFIQYVVLGAITLQGQLSFILQLHVFLFCCSRSLKKFLINLLLFCTINCSRFFVVRYPSFTVLRLKTCFKWLSLKHSSKILKNS